MFDHSRQGETPREPFIVMEDVSFRYSPSTHWILKDLSLRVPAGQFMVVLGANGSGKSTLARLMNGLQKPVTGHVRVAAKDTTDAEGIWDIRRRLGMVFQNPDNQIVGTTVEEDVAFGPENLGLPPPEIERRVKQAIAQVRLDSFTLRSPHLLSGGQKQRLAIAGILAMAPEGMILDEATSMLDPEGRHDVIQTVKNLNERLGLTVVHITHHMEEALLADRIIVMLEGKIVADGSPAEVFNNPDVLSDAGLEVPIAAAVSESLRSMGIDVPTGILDIEELVEFLCLSS